MSDNLLTVTILNLIIIIKKQTYHKPLISKKYTPVITQ